MTRLSTFIRRAANWLGPARTQALFISLAVTGLLSLILNAVNSTAKTPFSWIAPAQTGLLLIFLIGALFIVISRLRREDRRRFIVIFMPAIAAFSLALLYPSLWLLFVPTGIGWIFIAYVASRSPMRREYQAAIKHLRRDEYDPAIVIMSDLIKQEPNDPDHRRFRAELYRLAGKGRKARVDYEKVIALQPKSGVGYNGLAELYLQEGDDKTALNYAQQAFALEPDQWVGSYNLGMIEERLGQFADAIAHLLQALKVGVPDSRHRLLAHLWLARAYTQQADSVHADSELAAMRREVTGLNEWKTLFESKQAAVLREVLQSDVTLAEKLIDGETTLAAADLAIHAVNVTGIPHA